MIKNIKPLFTVIIGTRPEAIKLAPLIIAFKKCKKIKTRVILTGQHREMAKQVMNLFDVKEDKNLNLMLANQSINHITIEALNKLKVEFSLNQPELVIVQGDTTTAFSAALAAFYEKIPLAHVEAGLRTNDLLNPFPEEANRRLISQIAQLHFAPSKIAKRNLISSGIKTNIKVTGNTVIDSLKYIDKKLGSINYFKNVNWDKNKIILVTVHRRENWGKELLSIINGIIKILKQHQNVYVFLPVHPNPVVRKPIENYLGNNPKVFLNQPLDYDEMVFVLKNCEIVLTDSGGLQEEAPALGKPVLVLRKTTERMEAVNAGTAKIIGTNSENIFKETSNLLLNKNAYECMSKSINPYGDGTASKKILKECLKFIKLKS